MIDVTCAIIRNEDNQILIVRNGGESDNPFLWEFPGGKTEPEESDEDCIIREIREELNMDIVICSKLTPVEHDYGKKQIRLIPFVCDTLDELPLLKVHDMYRWIGTDDLKNTDFSEADIPVSQEYESLFGNRVERRAVDEKIEETHEQDQNPELEDMIIKMMGRQEAEWAADLAIENPHVFRKFIDYSITGDKKLAFRSSWILTKVCDKHPELIDPFLADIITRLNEFDNESVQRSFLRILSLKDINGIDERFHGILADYCFLKLNSGFAAIAIRAYAMDILYNLSTLYPEIANELAPAIMILSEDGSAGIKARGVAILKKINSKK